MCTDMGLGEPLQTSTRAEVLAVFRQVAEEQDKKLPRFVDALPLLESGLDSLCFAIIVARLEDVLGLDPFSAPEVARFPVTLGDFVRFYENAAT
jgi:hypothetical protein